MIEEWKPVPGHEGEYEVSNLGQVRSLTRVVRRSDGKPQTITGRILKQTRSGPMAGTLNLRGDSKPTRIGRLVAEVFIRPPEEGEVILRHEDDKTNNRVDNVFWGTRTDVAKALEDGAGHPNSRKTHCRRGHKLEAPNLARAHLKRGQRACLACCRANSFSNNQIRKDPSLVFDMQELSDRYYTKLTEEAA